MGLGYRYKIYFVFVFLFIEVNKCVICVIIYSRVIYWFLKLVIN